MLRIAPLLVAFLAATGIASAQGLDGRLKKIADSKTITIAYRTDAIPFSFADEQKQPAGYTVDLCKRVASLIEAQASLKDLKVKWVPVTSQNRFETIARGQADMECGSSTVTLTRMKQVDFSNYTFVDGTGLLTTAKTGIRSMTDIAGKRVGVIGGTTNERVVTELDKRRMLGLKVVVLKTRDEAIAALEEGKVDAFASDKILLIGAMSSAKDPKAFALLPDDLSFEPYAIALPRGDSGLRLAVNTALAHIYRNGEIGSIFNKWFGAIGEPTGLMRAMFVFGSLRE
jgi:glutamate/aspartate transport system substrate-binding protein